MYNLYLKILGAGKLVLGNNKAWFGSNKIELTKDTVYTHPSTQQCEIPLATTETAGLMSPADKLKLGTMSYNWTDLGSKSWDLYGYKNGSYASDFNASDSYSISGDYTNDFHSSLLIRVEVSITSASASASTWPYYNGPTGTYAKVYPSVSLDICGVTYASNSAQSDGTSKGATASISISSKSVTYYLLPTDGGGYDVFNSQSLDNKVGSISSTIQIRMSANTGGSTSTVSSSTTKVEGSGTVRVYVVL